MHICIFEDDNYTKLLPLVYFRPVYDLKCGITTLREKIARSFADPVVALHARDYLRSVLKEKYAGASVNEIESAAKETLFINGRVLASANNLQQLGVKYPGKDTVYTVGETVAAAWVSGKNLDTFRDKLKTGAVFTVNDFRSMDKKTIENTTVITYPWDLVHHNGSQLVSDFDVMTGGHPQILGKVYEGAHLLNPSRIHIEEGAKVKPGVVLDAEEGPIYISKNAKLMPNAVVEGPAFIGENSILKVSAKVYENTTIGETCKVGGEVEESIIHAYSNKQHEGFIGHAYLGEWVNIGADSNNSDLKNDYGNVKVYNEGKLVDTGSQFVGLTMADHSKCGINSMFNTGTVVGVCCNIFGAGMPPKFVPSYGWGGGAEGLTAYRMDKAVEVAKRVMKRRKIDLTTAGENLFKKIFELTKGERATAGIED